jgi:two-component system chemotaxis response regulator CheY
MPYRILIVDDSPAMQSIIERVIHLAGLEIEQILKASNGDEAMALLNQSAVDLVLTDINMPGSDGECLVRHLAEQGRIAEIPVIIVSTDSTHKRMNQLMGLGAKGYLAKPFTPEQLRLTIEHVLGVVHA